MKIRLKQRTQYHRQSAYALRGGGEQPFVKECGWLEAGTEIEVGNVCRLSSAQTLVGAYPILSPLDQKGEYFLLKGEAQFEEVTHEQKEVKS